MKTMNGNDIDESKSDGKDKAYRVGVEQLKDDEYRINGLGLCCGNCAFSRPMLTQDGESSGQITCHANPPVVVGLNDMSGNATREALALGSKIEDRVKPYTLWPALSEQEWCARFVSPPEWLQSLGERYGDRQQHDAP